MGHRDANGRDEREDQYSHDDPVVDEALDWFARLRNDEPGPEIRRAFLSWLARDLRHEQEFRKLEAIWGSTSFIAAVRSLPVNATVRRPRIGGWAVRAAAAAAVVLLAVGVWQYPAAMIAWEADYATATGHQSTISLPDGSSMMLNTASAVAVDFDGGRRNIRLLRGEAFFDVRRDPERPFVVTARFGEVKVLGTAFSVKSDEGQDNVVLERGKVDVLCLCDGESHAGLDPGQAVSISASALSSVRNDDVSGTLAWREGRITFADVRLGEVLDELRRYYGGTILVADGRVNEMLVSGNYRLDNIEGAIRTLADVAGIGMTRIPGGLIILR